MQSTVNTENQYPAGTIIEFIEFDLYDVDTRELEERLLTIGNHYLVEDFDVYDRGGFAANDESLVTFFIKDEVICLYPYQFRVVKPVQKSLLHFSGCPFSFF